MRKDVNVRRTVPAPQAVEQSCRWAYECRVRMRQTGGRNPCQGGIIADLPRFTLGSAGIDAPRDASLNARVVLTSLFLKGAEAAVARGCGEVKVLDVGGHSDTSFLRVPSCRALTVWR